MKNLDLFLKEMTVKIICFQVTYIEGGKLNEMDTDERMKTLKTLAPKGREILIAKGI